MNSLIIDCSYKMNLHLIREEEVYSFECAEKGKHTDTLLVEIDKLLNGAGIRISDIDTFGVCVGPGSFTGIRVAIASVKGLAVNGDCNVALINNFEPLCFGRDEKAYYLLEGFSTFNYVRKFDGKIFVDKCMSESEMIVMLSHANEDGYNIYTPSEKLQNLLKNNEIRYQNAENNLISCFLSKVKNKDFVKLHDIVPIYLRASQAELERQKKLLESVIKDGEFSLLNSKNAGGLFELEKKLFPVADLSKIETSINSDNHNFFTFTFKGEVIGFAECQYIAPEAELFEIGVAPEFQGIGLAKYILLKTEEFLKTKGCHTMMLEVNMMNKRAINLYMSAGFYSYSQRKNYYGDNDAILMKKSI